MFAMMMALAAAQAAAPVVVKPDGRKLKPVDQCFVIARGGQAMGLTRQTIKATTAGGKPAWDVVVHQRIGDGKFDMRDHFVLSRKDLLPISFDNRRNGEEHVRLRYASGRIMGTRTDKGIATPIDVAAPAPVWDGNLWGVTFGALPLRDGATFDLPYYQYDQGLAQFTLTVKGSEDVVTPAGTVSAWRVELPGRNGVTTLLLAKRDGAELGTRSGPFTTTPGGDCSGIDLPSSSAKG